MLNDVQKDGVLSPRLVMHPVEAHAWISMNTNLQYALDRAIWGAWRFHLAPPASSGRNEVAVASAGQSMVLDVLYLDVVHAKLVGYVGN